MEEKKEEKLEAKAEDPLQGKAYEEEEFDWDNYDKVDDNYSETERVDLETLYGETLSTIAENEVIDGVILAMTSREVVINIGYKSEGIVSVNVLPSTCLLSTVKVPFNRVLSC